MALEGLPTCHPGPEPSLTEASWVTSELWGSGEAEAYALRLGLACLLLALVFPPVEWAGFLNSTQSLGLSPETCFLLQVEQLTEEQKNGECPSSCDGGSRARLGGPEGPGREAEARTPLAENSEVLEGSGEVGRRPQGPSFWGPGF